ncbi:MAG: ParB/RepB/Spo0J family partition protein [Bacilli bacterium]|nr:ParB/RepB/Spo0J family partition protein [Bacilli bacterium]
MYPEEKDEVVQLYLDDIIPNRFQPREIFDEKALKELAVSIKEHGVIQPIIVRNVNGKYEIIAGERRYKASALAGLTKIPAIIRDLDDKESSKVALLENLQRKNLNPIEEARTYQKILEIDEMTQEQLAKTMGKSQSSVANKIRLLSLPEEIQQAILKEQISERHARCLLNVSDPNKQKELLQKVMDTKMSVRALEEEVKLLASPEEKKEEEKEEESPLPEIEPNNISFVNTEPLMPTAELPEDTSNYGKVTIVQPDGEKMPLENKFINVGAETEEPEEKEEEEEVKEEAKEEPKEEPIEPMSVENLVPEITQAESQEDKDEKEESMSVASLIPEINIDEEKERAEDLPKKSEKSAALDNLLNLGNPTSSTPSTEFITPAEKIVKADEENTKEKNSDYFQLPELSNTDQFNVDLMNSMDNSAFISSQKEEEKTSYTPKEAQEKLHNIIEELKKKNVKIEANEMDFEKSYQIIIKIDKEETKE